MALALALGKGPAIAQTADSPPALPMTDVEQSDPGYPPILDIEDRSRFVNAVLADRLERVVPAIMREQGIDMWVLIARENFEEPVLATMLDAESLAARRRTILVFYDPAEGHPVERMTVSRYGLGGMFEPVWEPEKEPDQFKRLAELIGERDPRKIAINTSSLTAYADGMTLSQYNDMMAALPQTYRDRIVSGETLAIRWLETRTPIELAAYPGIVRIAHAMINEAFSRTVITPGVTTTDQVVWWYRQRISDLGLNTWFQPSVAVLRQGVAGMLEGDTIIQPGDMLWTDFGITYLRLSTDTQHLAYVLREGEQDAPAGLKAGLRAMDTVRDGLLTSFRAGDSGNAVLARAREAAIAKGLDPSIYSHPLGYHGHAAGSAIGFWDNQQDDVRGDYPILPGTTWSIELAATSPVPEWDGQAVQFRGEEDAYFDGTRVRFLDGRQTELTLIPSD